MNGDQSTGLFFLDTNILVYSFDDTAPAKQRTAIALIELALQTQRGVISTQVVQEFFNVALRRFSPPLSAAEARDYLYSILLPLCRHFPSLTYYEQALVVRHESGFSYYDALVLTAAVDLGCTALFTEDMQAGRVVRGVKLINPFATL